jgi:drug/metabolite transporter (DMT)-like permease
MRAAPVSTYAYVNPLVAILLGNLLAQEPLTAHVLIAPAIVLSAVAVIVLNQPAREKSTLKAEPEPVRTIAPAYGDD